jgi:diguanylate cyclase (GGDEF)-like protein/PAS domain S-box-containing protein
MAYRKNPASLDELRELARKKFVGRHAAQAAREGMPDVQHLVEELEIHQIELELQNEHLNVARAQLEAALTHSSELYDFAPVGILSLDPTGHINKLNLAGARLLGGERARLLGKRLSSFVSEADRSSFEQLLHRATATAETQDGEIGLAGQRLHASYVQVRTALLPQGKGWQVVMVDITQRRKIEAQLRTNEERWKLALEAAGDGVWDWNVQTGEMILSSRFKTMFGYAQGERTNHLDDWTATIHPDDKPRVMIAMQMHLSGTTSAYGSEFRRRCQSGQLKWVLSRGAVVSRTDDGQPVRMLGTCTDITNRKQTEEALMVANRFQQAVFDSLAAQIVVLDPQGTILLANAAWRSYAACTHKDDGSHIVGSNYMALLGVLTGHDPQTTAAVAQGMAAVVAGEVPQFQLPSPFFTPVDQHWFSVKITPVLDAAERIVVSHEDVSSLKAAELASLTLANVDSLTCALSRRHFLNLAEQELARAIRYSLPLVLLMLDLDHFKRINDTFGHAAGDAVLKAFVQTVTGVLRDSDLIGRLGGEEFAVLLPSTTSEGGRALAQRIIDSVRESPVEVAGVTITYTVSVGAGGLQGDMTVAGLLGRADAALYRAKSSGRDRLEMDAD